MSKVINVVRVRDLVLACLVSVALGFTGGLVVAYAIVGR